MKKIVLTLLALAGLAVGAQGQIFSNAITDANPSASNPFTSGQVVASNLTAGGIGRGSGISGDSAQDRYNARSWDTASIDLDAYFTFTLDANTDFELDLTSFTYTGQASGTGPSSFAFRSSLDGFNTNIGSPTVNGTTIDLSGSTFQNLTDPVEFRFYGWNASSSLGTFSINDFAFNGAINAIPEPTTSLLLSLGLSTLILVRRNRRRA